MKKAFTLIELLVVIAIIAILAAILFPVFAQAKLAAKKAQAISNEKQISLSIGMYGTDYDDMYPRSDDCVAGSSLNPALNNTPYNPAGAGCTGPYFYRTNFYGWQKWVLPYIKSFDIFTHPVLDYKKFSNWTENGGIMGTFAINLSLTGALNTHMNNSGVDLYRNSWLGGTQTSVPDTAQTFMIMELVDADVNFAPLFVDTSSGTETRIAYPLAVRENWVSKFYNVDGSCNATSNTPDSTRVPFANSINLAYADGHVKTVQITKFLGNTPTASEYQVSSRPACGISWGFWNIGSKPVWSKPWPQWGLE